MEYLKSIILGIVQGLTEFLPVSSSGHLVFLQKLGFGEGAVSLFTNLMLHMGTLLAVVVIFRKRIWYMIKHPTSKEAKFLIIATIPTAIIAVIFKLFFEDLLGGKFLALGFMITTVMLLLAEFSKKRHREINTQTSIITGLVQGFATLPGISRSGSTIAIQMMLGVDREKAGDFSFLLSIPIILGSALVESLSMTKADFNFNVVALLLGVMASFIVGMFAIKFFLKMIRKAEFKYFAVYTAILAVLALIVL